MGPCAMGAGGSIDGGPGSVGGKGGIVGGSADPDPSSPGKGPVTGIPAAVNRQPPGGTSPTGACSGDTGWPIRGRTSAAETFPTRSRAAPIGTFTRPVCRNPATVSTIDPTRPATSSARRGRTRAPLARAMLGTWPRARSRRFWLSSRRRARREAVRRWFTASLLPAAGGSRTFGVRQRKVPAGRRPGRSPAPARIRNQRQEPLQPHKPQQSPPHRRAQCLRNIGEPLTVGGKIHRRA
jgi:hypothetical protein